MSELGLRLSNFSLIASFGFLISLMGCGSDSQSSQDVNFINLDCPGLASSSSYTDKMFRVINDPHEYREVYLSTDLDSQNEPPEVNFDTHTVIVLLAGFKPSLGHAIRVENILDEGASLRINFLNSEPKSCGADGAISYPYCYIAVNKTEKPVEFYGETSDSCS